MNQRIHAPRDFSLEARVVHRWALFYGTGASDLLDRPAHVRAGSGLTWLGDRLALVQDDANFVAILDPKHMTVESITLPAHEGRYRQFDELRGNRLQKLDLEACTTIHENDSQFLVAMGSGSSPWRERILVMKWPFLSEADIQLYHAPAFYQCLRSHDEFAGSELNIEGAAFLGGDILRLFQRGNGAPRSGRSPVNATCDVSWRLLRSHLEGAAVVPSPSNCKQYDLGALDGVRLTFTDGAVQDNCLFFTATAEASPDAIADGPVMGSILGQIKEDDTVRSTLILDENGDPLIAKVEGLSLDPVGQNRGWISIDRDDPAAPSELCEIMLSGNWAGPEGQVVNV